MKYKLYTLNNQFIKEAEDYPTKFTGIIEFPSGAKEWIMNGKYHRLGGPAYEGPDGAKHWWVDGKRHRLDGHAYEGSNGTKYWFVGNKEVSEEQCKLLYSIMKLKGLM